jgi:hypothetical protein
MNAIHFTSGNYLHIKTVTGQYAFRVTGDEALPIESHLAQMQDQIAKITRRMDAIRSYTSGESVSDPKALH